MNRRTFIRNFALSLATAPMAVKAMGSTSLTPFSTIERMVINVDGNIGFGTTNPKGTIKVMRDARNVLEMAADSFPIRETTRFCASGAAFSHIAWGA